MRRTVSTFERTSIMPPSSGYTRRGFLLGSATGLAAGASATWLAGRYLRDFGLPRFTGTSREVAKPPYAMPGPFPGRVVEVRHPDAVSYDHVINAEVVEGMIDRGMGELTGYDPRDVAGVWGRFFQKGEVIGIKVNPVGRKPMPGEGGRAPGAVGSISSPAVLVH